MKSTKHTPILRTLAVTSFLGLGTLVVSAGAQEAEGDEMTFEQEEKNCGDTVKSCNTKQLTELWGDVREQCAEFRSCKASARTAKKECKVAAKSARSCRGKKGAAKRKCKKQLRTAKKTCRIQKRKAINSCRKKMGSSCRSARNKFWQEVGQTAKTCGVDLAKACRGPAKD